MKIHMKKFVSVFMSLFFLPGGNMLAFAEAPKPQPGVKTVKNLLVTAIEPVGKTMYIWGGGWNEEDTGSVRVQRISV